MGNTCLSHSGVRKQLAVFISLRHPAPGNPGYNSMYCFFSRQKKRPLGLDVIYERVTVTQMQYKVARDFTTTNAVLRNTSPYEPCSSVYSLSLILCVMSLCSLARLPSTATRTRRPAKKLDRLLRSQIHSGRRVRTPTRTRRDLTERRDRRVSTPTPTRRLANMCGRRAGTQIRTRARATPRVPVPNLANRPLERHRRGPRRNAEPVRSYSAMFSC